MEVGFKTKYNSAHLLYLSMPLKNGEQFLTLSMIMKYEHIEKDIILNLEQTKSEVDKYIIFQTLK